MSGNGHLNGASSLAMAAAAPKHLVDAEHLQSMERAMASHAILSTGITRIQAIALKVAKGEMTPDTAWSILGTLGR